MKQKSVMGDFATVFGYYLKKEMRSKVYLIVTVLLLRVKGGVSYRGGVIDLLPGVPVPEGYWLEPSPGSGIVLHIPMEEVEEVFGQ